MSYVNALMIGAASPRPIRFVMDHKIFAAPFQGWIFRTAKAIPIAPAKEDPWLMEKAYVDIAQALHEGDLVCIFPEGKLTSSGEMNEFRGGIAKVVKRSKVPVIQMALRGLVGQPAHARSGQPVRTFGHAGASFETGTGGRRPCGAAGRHARISVSAGQRSARGLEVEPRRQVSARLV